MQIQINAATRLKIVAAEPTKLFNKLLKVLGKNYSTNNDRKIQKVTWELGHSRYGHASLVLNYDTVKDETRIDYIGFNADIVEGSDKDENRAWKKFKKEADAMLDSGDLTPEDRDQLEPLLKIK